MALRKRIAPDALKLSSHKAGGYLRRPLSRRTSNPHSPPRQSERRRLV